MARTALLYTASGEVCGFIYCAQDADMDLSLPHHERVVEVPEDHEALRDHSGWKVEIKGGRPEVGKKTGPSPERGHGHE